MEANRGRERRALTYDDRLEIERGLNRGDRIAWIARTIGRAPKVVAEEVRRNWTDDPQGMLVVRTRNICTKSAGCQARGLCRGMCRMRCSRCKDFLCNSLCEEFEASPCPRLDRTRSAATPARGGSAADAGTPIGSTRRNGRRTSRTPGGATRGAA